MFREQIGTVSSWFDRWSSCEQTVAMVALLRRLQPTQARFLTSVLQKQLMDCADLRRMEILANDSNYVSSLGSIESKESLVRELLLYLPLLSPKNTDVKIHYLSLIPSVLKHTLDSCSQMEEARQLLSYSLIHPAFTIEDRGLFAAWLHQFEEKLSSSPSTHESHFPSSCNNSPPNPNEFPHNWQQHSAPPPPTSTSAPINTHSQQQQQHQTSPGGMSLGNYGGSLNFHRIRRSNSLTPPVLHSDGWTSQDDLYSNGKPRSLSISSELSPQSSLASSGSGSESHLDDPRPQFTAPGMQDVPSWLKSLRLHKYSSIFAHLSFEEMLSLDEEKLEVLGVTKGARHKIVLSVTKLRQRPSHLKRICEEMSGEKEGLRNALNEIKWTLTTPIKPGGGEGEGKGEVMAPIGTSRWGEEGGEDVTDWIVKIIGKACELNPDMELEGLIVSVLERCLNHEAFSSKQKRLLSLWRQQQAPSILPSRRNSSGSHFPHFLHHANRTSGSPNSGSSSMKPHSRHFTPRVLNFSPSNTGGGWNTSGSSSNPTSANSIHAMFMAKRPSLQDSILEMSSGGSGSGIGGLDLSTPGGLSVPMPHVGSHNFGLSQSAGATCSSAMDITSRLESLCLSMTEAALGPAFSNY